MHSALKSRAATRHPYFAKATECRPSPQGTSSTYELAETPSSSRRKSTSACVCSDDIASRQKSRATPRKKSTSQFEDISSPEDTLKLRARAATEKLSDGVLQRRLCSITRSASGGEFALKTQ